MRTKHARYNPDTLIEIASGGAMVVGGVALSFLAAPEVGVPLALGGVAVLGDGLQQKSKAPKSHEDQRRDFRTLIKGAKA
jgi:hypothetical protein